MAFGHGGRDRILKRAAERLNDWAANKTWGAGVRSRFTSAGHILSIYIAADLKRSDLLRAPEGHNSQLTADEADLVLRHWPLVESEAQKIARRDGELYDRLTTIGRAELEKAVRRFDVTRGFTFGAFVRKRIRGSMLNYLERDWNREPSWADPADDQGKRWFRGMTRKAGAGTQIPERPTGEPQSRLIPGKRSLDALEKALAKLNHRQRAVYRGRVLRKPPLSRAELA